MSRLIVILALAALVGCATNPKVYYQVSPAQDASGDLKFQLRGTNVFIDIAQDNKTGKQLLAKPVPCNGGVLLSMRETGSSGIKTFYSFKSLGDTDVIASITTTSVDEREKIIDTAVSIAGFVLPFLTVLAVGEPPEEVLDLQPFVIELASKKYANGLVYNGTSTSNKIPNNPKSKFNVFVYYDEPAIDGIATSDFLQLVKDQRTSAFPAAIKMHANVMIKDQNGKLAAAFYKIPVTNPNIVRTYKLPYVGSLVMNEYGAYEGSSKDPGFDSGWSATKHLIESCNTLLEKQNKNKQ